jgi:hypothetical protein
MTHIQYEGKPLRSRDRIDWLVKLWDENGVENEAGAAGAADGFSAACDGIAAVQEGEG